MLRLEIERRDGQEPIPRDGEPGVVGTSCAVNEAVAECFPGIRIGGGKRPHLGVLGRVFRHRCRGQREVGGRPVDDDHRQGQRRRSEWREDLHRNLFRRRPQRVGMTPPRHIGQRPTQQPAGSRCLLGHHRPVVEQLHRHTRSGQRVQHKVLAGRDVVGAVAARLGVIIGCEVQQVEPLDQQIGAGAIGIRQRPGGRGDARDIPHREDDTAAVSQPLPGRRLSIRHPRLAADQFQTACL